MNYAAGGHAGPRFHTVAEDMAAYRNTMNTPTSTMVEQARVNAKLKHPWFKAGRENRAPLIIVGAGPSINDHVHNIGLMRLKGAHVWSVNGTHDWMLDRGMVPHAHVHLDSRPGNVCFFTRPQRETRYYISATCHPDVFALLADHKVTMWLPLMDETEAIGEEVGTPTLGFGGTVGLKALALAYVAGYRTINLFGYDSSYRGDEGHAFRQELNDGDIRTEVRVGDKTFISAPWMARQAESAKANLRLLDQHGCEVRVWGDGLLPALIAEMNATARESE